MKERDDHHPGSFIAFFRKDGVQSPKPSPSIATADEQAEENGGQLEFFVEQTAEKYR